MSELFKLVRFSTDYPISQFDCGIEDYNNFLVHDAQHYEDIGISSVHLLVRKETNEVVGYLALLTDSFLLDRQEKMDLELDIPFSSVPALKIGKLAAVQSRDYPYGSFLLELTLGFADLLEETGIACRFITVDADTEFNPNTPDFYMKNGFVCNEHRQYRDRQAISMRYDLFE